jgi:hypothetical protein
MRIGAALALIAIGAILRFGIAITMTHGLDLQIIGDILMGVGLLGLVLWLVVWAPRSRNTRRADYGEPMAMDGRPYPPTRTPGAYSKDDVINYDDGYRR